MLLVRIMMMFVIATFFFGCKTGGKNAGGSETFETNSGNAEVTKICSNMIVPQMKNDCLGIVDGKRYHSSVAPICGSIIVPQLANECLNGSAYKIYSPSLVSKCNGAFIPQEKVSCMKNNGASISRLSESVNVRGVCDNGVFESNLKQQCNRIAADKSFSQNAASLCNAIMGEKARLDCMGALGGIAVTSSAIDNCFQETTDETILVCAKKAGAVGGTNTPIQADNSSYCANIIVPQLKSQCVGVVNSGSLSKSAAQVCKDIIVPQFAIQCFQAVVGKTYTSSEVDSCKGIIPQTVVSCFQRSGSI